MFKKIIPLIPFLLVTFFALARGFLYYNLLQNRQAYFYSDDAICAALSNRFFHGDFSGAFNPYWNSGFSLISIPFYLITHQWESAQFLVSATSSTLLIFAVYFSLKKFSKIWAVLASFITASSPALVKLTNVLGTTEPFYILELWLAVYFGWEALQSKHTKYYCLTGIFFGLAYLTRTEAMYSFLVYLLLAFLTAVLKIRKKIVIKNKFTALSLLAGILAYSFFPIANFGRFIILRFSIFKSTRGIYFGLVFFVIAVMGAIFEKKAVKLKVLLKQITPKMALAVLFFLIINLPYMIAISSELGKLTFSGKYAFVGSAHPFTPERDRLTTWAQEIWSIDYPNYHSPYYDSSRVGPILWKSLDTGLEFLPKKIAYNLDFFAHKNLFTDFEAVLTIFGFLAGLLISRYRMFTIYLSLVWFGAFVAVSYFMDSADRYVAFSLPFFYCSQALLLAGLGRFLGKFHKFLLPLTVSVAVIVIFQQNINIKTFIQTQSYGRNLDQKIIGDYLKSQNIKLFMGRTEGLGFYSDARMIYIPAAPPEVVIAFAKAWGVEYIVSRPIESSWYYMRPLVDPGFANPDLKLIKRFGDDTPVGGTIIWKVILTDEEKRSNYRTGKQITVFCSFAESASYSEKNKNLKPCPDKTY